MNAETLTFKSGELAAVSISGEDGSGTLIRSNSQIKKILAFPFVANDQIIIDEDIAGTMKIEYICLLYTSPSPRDRTRSRMPSSA